jgi:hypothetical protein
VRYCRAATSSKGSSLCRTAPSGSAPASRTRPAPPHWLDRDWLLSAICSLLFVGGGVLLLTVESVKMSDGKYTQYAHLSKISVSKGQTVKARQEIGLSGATGNVSGPHLHFEARTGPAYASDIDPVAYLRSHGLSL